MTSMLRTRKPYTRSALRKNFLGFETLETRDVPATFWIHPSFGAGTTDFDLSTAGDQTTDADGPIVFGVDAFTSINEVFTAPGFAVNDTIVVNAAGYGESVTLSAANAVTLIFQKANAVTAASVNALAATFESSIKLNDTVALTQGGATSTAVDAIISGTGSLVKIGAGTFTLAGANTYTGTTTVSAGTLLITNSAALGATSAGTVVNNLATLAISGGIVTAAEPLTLAGNGVGGGGALVSVADSNTWSGPIVFSTGGARINSDAPLVLAGALGAAGNTQTITLAGAAAMTVSGVINSGTTGIGTAGLIQFVGGNTVTLTGSNASTFTSPILINNNTIVSYAVTAPLGTLGLVQLDTGTLKQTSQAFAVTFVSFTRNIQLLSGGGTLEYDNPSTPSGTANISIVQNTAPGTVISGVGELRFKGPGGVIALGKAATYTGGTRVLPGGYARTRNASPVFPTNSTLTVEATGRFDYSSTGLIQTFTGVLGAGEIAFNALTGGAQLVISSPVANNNTFSGLISGTGSGAVVMTGSGTQTFDSANTYVGTTTINGGTLIAGNGTGSAFGTGATTVNGGALASPSTANDGIITGPVTVTSTSTTAGTIAPGGTTATGQIRTGALSINAGGIYAVNLLGMTPGVGGTGFHDQIVATGGVALNLGTLTVNATGFAATVGDTFTIIDNVDGTLITGNGTFSALPEGATVFSTDGQTFKISYNSDVGNPNPYDVTLQRVNIGTRYVDDDWATGYIFGQEINGVGGDADPVAAGVQQAFFGTTAFATINEAYTASALNDLIVVNSGTYNESVGLDKQLKVTFQQNASKIYSLSGTDPFANIFLGGVNLQIGDPVDMTDKTYAGLLTGPGSITKVGPGTLILTGTANNYSGSTLVTAGILRAGATNAFSTVSALDVTTGLVQLNGFNNAVPTLTGSGIVENASATPAILTAGNTITNLAVNHTGALRDDNGAPALGGSLGFVKLGTGTLALRDDNAFTGPFTLQGGIYTVSKFVNAGLPSPFGASSADATNLTIRTTSTVKYSGATAQSTDRNITWGIGTIEVTTLGATVTIGGALARVGGPGGTISTFTKTGAGLLDFTNPEAFGPTLAATGGFYAEITTGTITVTGGELAVTNLRVNGTSRVGGARNLSISTGATATIRGTLFIDPGTSYISQVTGAGTLKLTNNTGDINTPVIAFDAGPSGGNGSPYGSLISANVNISTISSSKTVHIIGKGNRNDVGRYSGDLRFNNPITGTAPIQFTGFSGTLESLTSDPNQIQGKHSMHFVLNAANPAYTGAVRLANADLALTNAAALSAANSFTFNSTDLQDINNVSITANRAALFLFGKNVTIGSLNDLSAPGTTSTIRNGANTVATTGGTNTAAIASSVALGTPTDSILTIVQTTPGSFFGTFDNGQNDRGQLGNNPATGVTYKALSIVKQGASTLTVAGTNTMTGSVAVSDGTLVVDGSFATASALTVAAPATLAGNGTVPATTVTGRISPATVGTAGILTGTGNLTITGVYAADILGGTAGAGGYDQLAAAGTITLTGATFTPTGTFTPTTTDPLVVINNTGAGAIVGSFANAAPNSFVTINGTSYQVKYDGGTGSNDMVLIPQLGPAAVTSISVNAAAVQRSRITSITVNFAGPVSPAQFTALGSIRLTRIASPNGVGTPGTIVEVGATGAFGLITVGQAGPNGLLLTFTNANGQDQSAGVEHGSLTDGRWQLTIPTAGTGYTSDDANIDPTQVIRRLYGDINGDGNVDGPNDFAAFGSLFGTSPGVGVSPLDFDNNGDIDGPVDFAQFGNRFGLTV